MIPSKMLTLFQDAHLSTQKTLHGLSGKAVLSHASMAGKPCLALSVFGRRQRHLAQFVDIRWQTQDSSATTLQW
jgi:hypothetical protein